MFRRLKCTSPEVGLLLAPYQFHAVGEQEKEIFESHLSECMYCVREFGDSIDLYSVLDETRGLRLEADQIEPIAFHPLKWASGLASVLLLVGSFLVYYEHRHPASGSKPVTRATEPAPQDLSRLVENGRYAEAIVALEAHVKNNPSPSSYLLLGYCYYSVHQNSKAVAPLLHAIDSTNADEREQARWFLAKAYLELQQPAHARGQLREIVQSGGRLSADAKALLKSLETGGNP